MLRDVDLDRRRGRAACWWPARTGSGKSTLLGVVTGLVPRFSGGGWPATYCLDGAASSTCRPGSGPSTIGYVAPGPGRRASSPTRSRRSSPTGWSSSGCPADTMRRRVEETLDLLGIADLRAPRPAHPVRRPAAAGRDRVGAHDAPAPARARRADLGARPDRRRGRAGDADPAGPRPRASRCCSPSTGSSGWCRSRTGWRLLTGDGAAPRRRAGRRAGRLAGGAADRRARPRCRLVAAAADRPGGAPTARVE